MGKRLWSFLAICVFAVSMAFAQQKVTGVVIEAETGEPVVGASVLVKGSSVGAATDINGKFTISNVPSSAKTLMVSYIGMTTKEVAIKSSAMKILLESDSKLLSEQMVVAFGTTTKEAFTGSATVMKSEDIEKHTTSNVANTLVGSVPGLTMRGSSGLAGSGTGSINIRGIASMYASTDPLIIVDGAPFTASLNNINPDDVESITVLKDASSAALYGARGAAGVIIITTKRGKTKDAVINVNMKWGANTRAVQDYDKITDPAQYYEAAYANYYNYGFYGQGWDNAKANSWANETMIKHLGYNIYNTNGEPLIGKDGKINPNAKMGATKEMNGETYYYQADNWQDAAYHTAFRQEYDINASAATDRTNFYISGSYLNEDGIIDNSSFERFTARAKFDYQARPWLKLGVNVNWVHSTTESNPNNDGSLGSTNLGYYTSHIAPIYPIYVRVLDANGNPVIRTDANGNKQYDYGRAGLDYPDNRAFLQTGNPLGSNHYNNVWSKGNQLNATGFAEVKFTDFLKLNVNSNIVWGHSNFSDYESGLYGPKVSVNGQIGKSQTDAYRQNHLQTLMFNKNFGDHNVGVTLGHEYTKTETTYLFAEAQGLFSPEIQEINAAANNQYNSGSYTSAHNVEGYFGNALYNYQEKYFAQFALRRDATSRFYKDNRWGTFWSLGAGWLINKESFFNVKNVDMLKFKASIGQKGNENIGNFRYTDTYGLTKSGTYTMSPVFSVMGNPNITWETTTATNFGFDFGFFGNRLNGSIEYYYNKTTDLLFWLSIPESMGSRGYYGNLGDIRNTGIELSLMGTPIRTKDFQWDINFNISSNSTKVLKLPATKKGKIGGFAETGSNIQMWYEEGKPLYNAFLYEYAGVNDKGEALYWYDEDLSPAGKAETNKTDRPGKKHSGTTTLIGEATRYDQGTILPKAFGGFGTTFKIYDFDINAQFDYQIGGKVYDYTYMVLMGNIDSSGSAGSAMHKDVLKAWTPNNTNSNIPRMQYQDKYTAASSNRWLTNAGYLNFQSFTVGYTLPASIVRNLGISKLRVYCSGENLCFWSARKGLDPRYSFEGNDYVQGYSPVRTIMGGIQVSF